MAFPSVDQIVDGLRTTRAEFEFFFLQAQQRAGIATGSRQQFALVATEVDSKAAFRTALTAASNGGFLRQFALVVIGQKLATKELEAAVAKALRGKKELGLQAIVDADAGFNDVGLTMRGMGIGQLSTARITIKGKPEGTGVLVAPDRVLTAWHVVQPLFLQNAKGSIETRPGSSADLIVEFDDVTGFADLRHPTPAEPRRIPVADDWCIAFSPCHQDELAERIPDPLSKLTGLADYALIRLAAPQNDRPPCPIEANAVVPSVNEGMILFQHPDGKEMKWTTGKVDKGPRGLTGLRFLHGANSLGGSSGGPCFDKEFTLIGVHQGAWKRDGRGKLRLNRGVPISAVYADLTSPKNQKATATAATGLWRLGKESKYSPVFGARDYQTLMAQAADAGTPRVIVIAGTEGSGKTYCIRILEDALAVSKHCLVVLGAGALAKEDAPAIAARIATKMGATLDPITPVADYSSTPSAWLRDEVVSKLTAALARARGDRTVWLCIEDLNDFRLEGDLGAELLLLLYEETRHADWLRIVLDGATGDLPATIADLAARHELAPIARKDIEEYVTLACGELHLRPTAAQLKAKLDAVMTDLTSWRTVSPSSALGRLSLRVQEMVADMLPQKTNGGGPGT